MLHEQLGYDNAGKRRYRKLIRLAALLHDVGHGPFSHAVEDLAPPNEPRNSPYQHEDYSTAVIRQEFRDIIENHNANNNFNFRVDEIAGLIEGGAAAGRAALWRDLIAGQLDADRMDYLLRDSYHAGVEYGRYDWRRIVATVQLVPDIETGTPRIGVSGGGRHAAEGLIIARYMMFNQVYFHKTRVILDFHLQRAVKEMLPGGMFSPPVKEGINQYLKWDDWQILGRLANGEGGDDGRRLVERDFFREVWETPEFPSKEDEARLVAAQSALGKMLAARCEAAKSWYKVGASDLLVAEEAGRKTKPLSLSSTIVAKMSPSKRIRLYVRAEDREAAIAILGAIE